MDGKVEDLLSEFAKLKKEMEFIKVELGYIQDQCDHDWEITATWDENPSERKCKKCALESIRIFPSTSKKGD